MPWGIKRDLFTASTYHIDGDAGMAGWLFYAHQLIEKKTAKSQRVYRYIYNSTTLVTLSLITLINYVILYYC